MTFSNYGHRIPREPVEGCRVEAVAEAFTTHQHAQMGTADRRYRMDVDTGTVVLSLAPSPRMTWSDWKAGLMGVNTFVGSYQTVEFLFSMRRLGENRMLGLGYLAYSRDRGGDV